MKKAFILLFMTITYYANAQEKYETFLTVYDNDKKALWWPDKYYYSIVTKKNEILGPYQEKPIIAEGGFYYKIFNENKFGRINLNGEIVFEKELQSFEHSRKHAVVKENSMIGAINTKGEYSIKLGVFDSIGPLVNKYTWAKKGEKLFIIDSLGIIITETKNIKLIEKCFNHHGIALACSVDNKYNYINIKGEFITDKNGMQYSVPTTDSYKNKLLLKLTAKSAKYYSENFYFTPKGEKLSSKYFDKQWYALNYKPENNSKKTTPDFDIFYAFNFNKSSDDTYLVNQNGNKITDDDFLKPALVQRRVKIYNDTIAVPKKYDRTDYYIYKNEELVLCKSCEPKWEGISANYGSNDWESNRQKYFDEANKHLFNDLKIQDGYYDEKNLILTKQGKYLKNSVFEKLTIEDNFIFLLSDLESRARSYWSQKNPAPSRKVSERWADAVKEFINGVDKLNSAVKLYKMSPDRDHQFMLTNDVNYCIDKNKDIIRILSYNDGSLSATEFEQYNAIAKKKASELENFKQQIGSTNISTLEAIIIGLSRIGQ